MLEYIACFAMTNTLGIILAFLREVKAMFDIALYALAGYGLYVLIGAPPTDQITALGRKALDWLRAKLK